MTQKEYETNSSLLNIIRLVKREETAEQHTYPYIIHTYIKIEKIVKKLFGLQVISFERKN